jgi:hypothetical protein
MSGHIVMQQAESITWTELRDEQGKLCARLDVRRLLLEIRRSDRDLIAYFDLREYVQVLEMKTDIE